MKNLKVEDPEVKRKVIKVFAHKIIFFVDRIDVTYKIEPSDSNEITDSDKVGGGEPILTISLSIYTNRLYNSKSKN